MRSFVYLIALLAMINLPYSTATAQEKLYDNTFPLGDVQLLDGPFRHARDLNIKILLEYDVDRLLAPYRKEAGLSAKASGYPNWEGLDGHVGGHYLSALAMNYAATGNEACRKRMEYMIAELKICQDANTKNHGDWGMQYVGGVPKSAAIWQAFLKKDFGPFRGAWVPWYNLHKMFAGLRDAWLYAGNEEAKNIFLSFCDWGIHITSSLTDAEMQSMLDVEHGGMNEVYADAYQISGEEKYLQAARRFSHNMLLDAMASEKDNLDNKHANTQVPKAVGFQRIGALIGDDKYEDAGRYFWTTVTEKRTLAFGGNSRREFFPSVSSCGDFVVDVEGPETCNSYNMLKLTEGLFRTTPSAKYIDYYERTLYNHILSTQHPEHGGYVYFTPARPRHYKVYSAPNEAMWCCVGSGMENHGKYNQLIYTHRKDSLFLNLFIASELNWKSKGIRLKQQTKFPDEGKTTLSVSEGKGKFTLMVRHPSWVKKGKLQIAVNGKKVTPDTNSSGYVAVQRQWKKGDVVEVTLPMQTRIEQLPNVPEYIAIMHGPILLSAKTGSDNLRGLVADDSRWGHIASGERLAVNEAPILIEDNKSEITKLVPVEGKPLTFRFPEMKIINPANLELQPFFRIHDSRYMMYWMALTTGQYKSYLDSLTLVEKKRLELESRTIDFVAPGEQQPEVDHALEQSNSRTGNHWDAFWRDASGNGYFSYKLKTNGETGLRLIVRYWGAEWGSRKFDIYIDDKKLISEDNTGRWNQSKFFDIEYTIPDEFVKERDNIRVKFQALPGNTAGAVYYLRLAR